jgi:hypothetical protein
MILKRLFFILFLEPMTLSLWGALYLGVRHAAYLVVVAWAVGCAAYFLWLSRTFLIRLCYLKRVRPSWADITPMMTFVIFVVVLCVSTDSLCFLLGEWIAALIDV